MYHINSVCLYIIHTQLMLTCVQTPAVEKVVLFDLLNCEEVFYWSCLCRSACIPLLLQFTVQYFIVCVCMCRYLHGMGVEGDEHMEKIVPTVSEFCEYVQRCGQHVYTHTVSKHTTLLCYLPSPAMCRKCCYQWRRLRRGCRNSLSASSCSPSSPSWTSRTKLESKLL